MWRDDDVGTEFKDTIEAYRRLREAAQEAIVEGDRCGVDMRNHRVRLRDEADNQLFDGTFAEAAVLQFGSDARALSVTKKAGDRPKPCDRRGAEHEAPPRALMAQMTEIDAEMLQVSKEHLRVIGQATSDALYRMSADWSELRALTSNGFVAATTGSRHSWLDMYIPAEDHPPVLARIEAAIRAKSVFDLEHRVIRVDGSVGWTRSCAVPVVSRDGHIVEWIGAADDITTRREATARNDAEGEVRHLTCEHVVQQAICDWTKSQPGRSALSGEEHDAAALAVLIARRLTAAGLVGTERADSLSPEH